MAEKRYYKYIICPSCQIGGYDFCPDCLGAGGYSIPCEENESSNYKVVSVSLLQKIGKKLDLIVKKNLTNQLVEKKLIEYLTVLTSKYNTEESLKLVARILKILHNTRKKELAKTITKKLIGITQIVVDCDGDAAHRVKFDYFLENLFTEYLVGYVPIKNDFFNYTYELGFMVTLRNKPPIGLSKKNFIKLINFLKKDSKFDYINSSTRSTPEFAKKIKSSKYRSGLIRLSIYNGSNFYDFILERLELIQRLNEYFSDKKS